MPVPTPGKSTTESPYLCAAYPDVAGVVVDAAPTIERCRFGLTGHRLMIESFQRDSHSGVGIAWDQPFDSAAARIE